MGFVRSVWTILCFGGDANLLCIGGGTGMVCAIFVELPFGWMLDHGLLHPWLAVPKSMMASMVALSLLKLLLLNHK